MLLKTPKRCFTSFVFLASSALFAPPAISAVDMSDATTINIDQYVSELATVEQQKIDTYHDMISSHLSQNFSIVRTVRILTAHYPQDVKEILLAAYRHHPKMLTVISRAVIRREPALTSDVLDTALAVSPEDYQDIVRMAIKAEPAYIDDIVAVAAQHNPNNLDEIVRVAITAEPDLSGSIIQSAALNSPSQFLTAIVNTVASIPESTTRVFYAVKDFLTGQDTVSRPAVKTTDQEQWHKFLRQAKAQGVTKEEMLWFKQQGYISEQQLTAVYNSED